MQEFPYPINIIPITYTIINEIEKNLNKEKKLIKLEFFLNLPSEKDSENTINNNKNIPNLNDNYVIHLLKNKIISKIEKIYNTKINISISKKTNTESNYLLKVEITFN